MCSPRAAEVDAPVIDVYAGSTEDPRVVDNVPVRVVTVAAGGGNVTSGVATEADVSSLEPNVSVSAVDEVYSALNVCILEDKIRLINIERILTEC